MLLKKITPQELEEKTQIVLQNIVARRQALGISQHDMSMHLNLTPSGYFKVEKGETKLDLYRLFEIADFLKIEAKELF